MRPALLPLFVLVSVVVTSCASSRPSVAPQAPSDPLQPLRAEIGAIREEAERLHRAQAELYWRSWIGAEPGELAETYVGREQLFSAETIARVAELQAKTDDPLESRALAALRLYLVSEHVGRETAAQAEAIAAIAGPATITIDGRHERPYRDLDTLLAREPDAARRRRILQAGLPVVRRLTPLLLEKQRRQETLLASLGEGGYAPFSAALRGVDPVALAELADRVLAETEKPYVEAMTRLARERLGMSFDKLHRADLPRLFRGAEVDDLFPRDAQLARARSLAEAMGFSLDALTIDDGAATYKSPRPLAVPVSIPDDVRLSVKPSPGLAELARVCHEVVHALHHAHTSPKVPWELALLGSQAVPEAWAQLFDGLFDDPRFLAEQGVRDDRLEALVLKRAARRLFDARRAAGLVLYELALQGRTAASPPETYRAILSRAYGFPLTEEDAERYALDREDFLASADHLRAALLAARLHRHLDTTVGADWWRNPRTAEVLRPFFAEGNGLDVEALLARIGADGLDPGTLLGLVQERLGPSATAAGEAAL